MKILGLLFMRALLEQYFPHPHHLNKSFKKHSEKLLTFLSPRVQITFDEFVNDRSIRNEAFSAIETYLSSTSSAQARRLKAEMVKCRSQSLFISMDDNQKVADEFEGVKVWWSSGKTTSKTRQVNNETRFYKLIFHHRHKKVIFETYLNHVLSTRKNRIFFINSGSSWSHAPFEHPGTFQALAMEPEKKIDIVNDLLAFSKNEDFYSKIGRVWRRVYFLHGPFGTGKSTIIAAMSNLLGYDVYELDLTVIKNRPELKKLLIETSRKSIIVIRDFDCSLDFVDGIWSFCGGGRIIVYISDYVGKLYQEWIKRCYIDKHIEMCYCGFEGFKVLAKKYLDMEWHHLFPRIEDLLRDIQTTPADVAQILMQKSVPGNEESCLKNLITSLEKVKENDPKI